MKPAVSGSNYTTGFSRDLLGRFTRAGAFCTELCVLQKTPYRTDLPTVLPAEDDDGHTFLMQNSLRKAGFRNSAVRFSDGQEALDYLLSSEGLYPGAGGSLLLLLDIRMPKVVGTEILLQQAEPELYVTCLTVNLSTS